MHYFILFKRFCFVLLVKLAVSQELSFEIQPKKYQKRNGSITHFYLRSLYQSEGNSWVVREPSPSPSPSPVPFRYKSSVQPQQENSTSSPTKHTKVKDLFKEPPKNGDKKSGKKSEGDKGGKKSKGDKGGKKSKGNKGSKKGKGDKGSKIDGKKGKDVKSLKLGKGGTKGPDLNGVVKGKSGKKGKGGKGEKLGVDVEVAKGSKEQKKGEDSLFVKDNESNGGKSTVGKKSKSAVGPHSGNSYYSTLSPSPSLVLESKDGKGTATSGDKSSKGKKGMDEKKSKNGKGAKKSHNFKVHDEKNYESTISPSPIISLGNVPMTPMESLYSASPSPSASPSRGDGGNVTVLSTLPPSRSSKSSKKGKSGKKSPKALVSQVQNADVSTPNKGKTMALSAFATVGVLGVGVGVVFVVSRLVKRRRRHS